MDHVEVSTTDYIFPEHPSNNVKVIVVGPWVAPLLLAALIGIPIIVLLLLWWMVFHNNDQLMTALPTHTGGTTDVEMQVLVPPPTMNVVRGVDPLVRQNIPEIIYHSEESASIPYEEYKCAMCLYEFSDGESLVSLPPCGHVFHSHCIDPYLSHATTCPSCRRVIAFTDGESRV